MPNLSSKAKAINVLVVDDAPTMRALLVAILKSFGIKRVYDAEDGVSAVRVLESHSIDLIFCDWEMPLKSGIELFQELRDDAQYKDIPFVLVTSVAEMDKVKTAIQSGIKYYIVKPFKELTLLERLNEIFPE